MALSKSTRILILLAIDSAFFLLELITGYYVHSLALVADAFHMLNDVLSLCVGYWAVKVATQKTSSKMYTYGWQRAETLGALINGVFLVALCVTIFLEAIQRFVEPQIVSNPKFVLIVGCLGLASNIVGLFLFHDHSHGPGGHSHGPSGHSHGDEVRDAEEGHAGHSHEEPDMNGSASETTVVASPASKRKSTKHSRRRSRAQSDVEDLPINPGALRRSIIEAGRLDTVESEEVGPVVPNDEESHDHMHDSPLLKNKHSGYGTTARRSIDHKQHKHSQPKDASAAHGHSHGDLNMRGIFLHVMGDALGNVGVIATALIIWLTDYSWRFYFDPAISLVITIIILCSAIPLCKAASRILLQAVPAGISIDDIQDDIQDLPGIISCHHLHVWQLSDTKLVASLHVQVSFDFEGDGSARYMELAQAIRKCLHEYGIHSSTIQPEFCLDPEHDHMDGTNDGTPSATGSAAKRSKPASRIASQAGSVREADACLLGCGDECGDGKACCDPPASSKDGSHDGHNHSH
ncbi:zinc/cadmium resistance protein [Acrodontium crateriforme]|uniref:Zinc/cadmium resistance protein n=1 Tax=Acrodontium crateriforme TaxID=150365 RepID=A0AAQ3M6E5_9PEZI|nr:zinc/cadmium resistance protein [Acrodontium crateriforme]